MSKSGYKPLNQEPGVDDLLGDILSETAGNFKFDPASYFDDWFDEPASITTSSQNAVESSTNVSQSSSEEEEEEDEETPPPSIRNPRTTGNLIEFQSEDVEVEEEEVRIPVCQPQEVPEYNSTRIHSTDPRRSKRKGKSSKSKPSPPRYSESSPTFAVPYGDESLGYRERPPYRNGASRLAYEEDVEGDELSYDHYDLVQAGVEPSTFSKKRYPRQVDLADSGVVIDVIDDSPYLGKINHNDLGQDKYDNDDERSSPSNSISKQSFDIAMSDEETAKKARWCLICLKTYCIIFMLTIISLSIYIAADLGDFTTDAQVAKKETLEKDQTSGYKELRLGGRRVYYRIQEPREMANHTVLLIHGENQSGELFKKLGTLSFLSTHGARAVAIDVIGYGQSDPPIHIPETYEGFFTEIVSLFELEYNLILVCIEQGCEKILPYYLKHGVYKQDNSFIEGAIFVSPRGTTYNKFIEPDKSHMNTATRTLDVNGGKDQYLNMEVNKQLSLIPRCEIHSLPELKNGFYSSKHGKQYFHAALQAFMEGLVYEYDQELEEISQQQQAGNQPNSGNQLNQYGYGYSVNNQPQQYQVPQGGDAFSRFQAKQQAQSQSKSTFQDLGYNPAKMFSSIKGKKKK
ncbi:hypothetical protein ACHWQZ_G011134 [Mnemiopsis leidyi]